MENFDGFLRADMTKKDFWIWPYFIPTKIFFREISFSLIQMMLKKEHGFHSILLRKW